LPAELPEELRQLAAAGLSSTAAGAAPAAGAPSDWQLTAEELQRYLEYFEQLAGGAGTVAPERAQDFLAGSGLPPQELTYIWDLLDASHVGSQEFVCAMALADRRRRGQNLPGELPEELALQAQDVPRTLTARRRSSEEGPAAAPLEGLEEYRTIFRGASQGSDFVDGAAAKDVLEKSGLPVEDLMKIWFLADNDKDGRLSEPEFVYAMALANARRQGEPVPSELPPELIAAAAAMS
jgi:epidermal growth factor receptor substrate 15